jgi:hypothetical protein
MTVTESIQIKQLIVHKLDHKRFDQPQFAELATPFNGEVASFLRHHIRDNRAHRYARQARFVDPKPNTLCLRETIDQLLNDANQFVPRSQEIGQCLWDALKGSASPGDLVLCTFAQDSYPDPWLAILKMDPADGFVAEEVKRDGKRLFVIRHVPEVLPTGDLQKCAFVLPASLRAENDHDLIVLDQQMGRYRANAMVARFFSRDFLQCEVGMNRKDVTECFILDGYAWADGKREIWGNEKTDALQRAIMDQVAEPKVDVVDFAAQHIEEPEEQDDFVNTFREAGMQDLVFEPDPEQQPKYVYFDGDNGLRLRVPRQMIDDDKEIITWRREGNETIVTIRTLKWKKRPR